jgi:hypothetical protein
VQRRRFDAYCARFAMISMPGPAELREKGGSLNRSRNTCRY